VLARSIPSWMLPGDSGVGVDDGTETKGGGELGASRLLEVKNRVEHAKANSIGDAAGTESGGDAGDIHKNRNLHSLYR
jgi:hypothetical protein